MEIVKSAWASVKNSPIGAIGGGLLAFYAAKKKGNISNKYALVGIAIVGALVGSAIEYKIKAKTVKPAIDAKK